MARIGFLGIGHMGFPMASNLLRNGHEVIVYDLMKDACHLFRELGGEVADAPEDLLDRTAWVFTMLQSGDQVKQVLCGKEGLMIKNATGATFVDCSTIDVDAARFLHQEAERMGVNFIESPVSGGVAGAAMGTLTFMVGGRVNIFERVKPILKSMGKTIIHTGDAGSAQAAKICNNMMLGISMIGVSEAFLLAERLGLSAAKLHEVAEQSSGQSWVMSKYVPVPDILPNVPANNDYQPGFTAAMMLKDLRLSQECAKEFHTSTPLASKAMDLYEWMNQEGLGSLDFSAIIKMLRGKL